MFLFLFVFSQKWDEWVEVGSKRIQPQWCVNDRLTVLDSIGKETSAVVTEVSIIQNQLKIYIHFPGWSEKWDEWLPVTHKRIIARHPYSERHRTHPSQRPATCSFEVAGKIGKVIKLDLREGNADGPLVLLKVTHEQLTQTVYLWMKLSLLKPVPPVSQMKVLHMANVSNATQPIYAAPDSAVSICQLSTFDLLHRSVEVERNALSASATSFLKSLLQHHFSHFTPVRSYTSPLRHVQPSRTIEWPFGFSLTDLIQLYASDAASDIHSMLTYTEPQTSQQYTQIPTVVTDLNFKSSPLRSPQSTTSAAANTSRIHQRQHFIRSCVRRMEDKLHELMMTTVNKPFTWITELDQLLRSSAVSLQQVIPSVKQFSLTIVKPGSSQSVSSSCSDVSLQLITCIPTSDIDLKSERVTGNWLISFFADQSQTQCIKEMIITSDPISRTIAPFLVPATVYISASLQQRKKGVQTKAMKTAPPNHIDFAITPFTTHAAETIFATVEIMSSFIRQLSTFSIIPQSQLTTVEIQCEQWCRTCYTILSDFVLTFHNSLPLPSNLKVRCYESLSTLITTLTYCTVQRQRDVVQQLLFEDEEERKVDDNQQYYNLHRIGTKKPVLPEELQSPLDFHWLLRTVIGESQRRYTREKQHAPLHSVYLQRCIELLLTAVRYEEWCSSSGASDGHPMTSVRLTCTTELPVVLYVEKLLLLAVDSRAHAPLLSNDQQLSHIDSQSNCQCSWCKLLEECKEETATAIPLIDLAYTSIIRTVIQDEDYYVLSHVSENNVDEEAHFSGLSTPDIQSISQPTTPTAMFHRSTTSTSTALTTTNILRISDSSSTSTAITKSNQQWRHILSLSERLLPNATFRSRIFNLLLNSTAVSHLPKPEIAFRRGAEHEAELLPPKPNQQPKPTTSLLPGQSSSPTNQQQNREEETLLQRTSMFQQLCDAFIKSSLHRRSSALRAEVGSVTWKTVLAGALDHGAAGLPGPFRQSLFEICQYLTENATNPSSTQPSLLIPCPNSRSQTGDDRNKMIVNPAFIGEQALVQCRIFGQLLGVAVRSKCCLDLDLAESFWKSVLGLPLIERDLATFDFTAARTLKFTDPSTDIPFSEEDFTEYFSELTWTTVLSDGRTTIELKPNGAVEKVTFEQRQQYAKEAIQARLHESALQIQCIREGLHSVIPAQSLDLISCEELELRVCGRSTIDLEVLKQHTVYSPSTFTIEDPVISNFWSILSEPDFNVASFLQFAWARSRLPSETGTYRMQINILEKAAENALPTAET